MQRIDNIGKLNVKHKKVDGKELYPQRVPLPAHKIRLLWNYVNNFCKSLMATDVTLDSAKNRTTAYAMIYLCLVDECYKTINRCDKYDGWSTTYTLLGILRAPSHFLDFKWVRALYEGGDMGEGVIRHIRPLSPTGIKDGWASNLIQTIIGKM